MSVTITNGINEAGIELRPWSPAGAMATALPDMRANIEYAIARKSILDTYIYPDSSLTSNTTYYFPPMPSGFVRRLRVSRTAPFNYLYMRHGGTTYAVSLSTTGVDLAWGSSKYIRFYSSIKPQSSWDTTAPVRVQFLPAQFSEETTGYVSSYTQKPGTCLPAVADRNLANMMLNFPHLDNGGVSAAEFNQLRACAIQAADFPVLHACIGCFSTNNSFSGWLGFNFPLAVDPSATALQKLLTLVFHLGGDGPAALKVYVGGARGGVIATALKQFYTDSVAEYQVDLSNELRQVEPLIQAANRRIYEINVQLFEGDKNSQYIYSWAAYTGVPAGAMQA